MSYFNHKNEKELVGCSFFNYHLIAKLTTNINNNGRLIIIVVLTLAPLDLHLNFVSVLTLVCLYVCMSSFVFFCMCFYASCFSLLKACA